MTKAGNTDLVDAIEAVALSLAGERPALDGIREPSIADAIYSLGHAVQNANEYASERNGEIRELTGAVNSVASALKSIAEAIEGYGGKK